MADVVVMMMKNAMRLALAAVIVSTSAIAALAQPMFTNPFTDVSEIMESRGTTTNAVLRLRYRMDESRTSQEERTEEIVFDIADNWVLVQRGGSAKLYDLKLGRVFFLEPDENRFLSFNRMANMVFLIAERQNRDFLVELMAQAGLDGGADSCDADTGLGLTIPNTDARTVVSLGAQNDGWALECNGRQVGVLEISSDVAPPAFWPVMLLEMPTHPVLNQKAADSRSAPARLSANYHQGPDTEISRVWTLLGTETIDTAYPLLATFENTTGVRLDEILGDGVGALALEVVEGHSGDGPPTLQKWDAYLGEVAADEGDAALGFLIPNSLSMFPDLVKKCEGGAELVLCDAIKDLRQIIDSDPAVKAYYMVASMEQQGDVNATIPFMLDAKTSKYADHPVLGGAFAQALKSGGPEFQKKALEAGLPSDPLELILRALRAYPYNPVYWTDLGDWFAGRFEHNNAFILYDVAFSVPIASDKNLVLASRLELVNRIRHDFPRYFLQTN